MSAPLIDFNGRVRDRAREQRQRRARLLLRVVTAAAVLSALAWIATASPLFSVRKVVITGNRAVPTEAIRSAAAIAPGTPLARVDAAGAAKRLQSLPGVGRGEVTVALPDTVTIAVSERAIAFVVQQPGGFAWVDPTGAAFSQSATRPAGVPLARVGLGDQALLADVGTVVGALPAALQAKVTLLAADSRDSITVQVGERTTVVWGSADDSPLKGQVAGVLYRSEPTCRRIDVSSPATPATHC